MDHKKIFNFTVLFILMLILIFFGFYGYMYFNKNLCSSLDGNWVYVKGNKNLNTTSFCVMKYEAKNLNDVPTSIPNLYPWTNISQNEAKLKCQNLGENVDLITNDQWTTIAREIELNSENIFIFDNERYFFSGHNDNDPPRALEATNEDLKGYFQTNVLNDSNLTEFKYVNYIKQKRTLILADGEIIWDFSGNVWEWVDDTCDNQLYYSNKNVTTWDNINLADFEKKKLGPIGKNYSMFSGIGAYEGCINNGNGFTRGGAWYKSIMAGVFSVTQAVNPELKFDTIGFRCVYIK